MTVKQLNVSFDAETHAALLTVKGDRTWRQAIVDEFRVN